MGCGTAREKLEDLMVAYKLQRMEVQIEKEKELKKLAQIEGHNIERSIVPDYIDPKFAKEKRLNIEEKDNKENDNNNKIHFNKRQKSVKVEGKKKIKN